jgi:hypothetical protein
VYWFINPSRIYLLHCLQRGGQEDDDHSSGGRQAVYPLELGKEARPVGSARSRKPAGDAHVQKHAQGDSSKDENVLGIHQNRPGVSNFHES